MEMASRFQEPHLPIKLMTISNAEDGRRNSNRHQVLSAAGSHSMYGGSNAEDNEDSAEASTCGKILIFLSWVLVFLTMPISMLVCFKVVQEYERAVIFRLGRLMQGGAKGPGEFLRFSSKISALINFNGLFASLQVLTKDSVTVSVDAVVYYRVNNATISIANVENAHHSTRLLAQTTLRNTMGTRHLHEILSERMTISGSMQVSGPFTIKFPTMTVIKHFFFLLYRRKISEAFTRRGNRRLGYQSRKGGNAALLSFFCLYSKDVRLPVQLQRAMAAEAEASREARAKVIAAEGEQKASRALREASEIIGDSPAALQLRYLQTLNTISSEKNSTIVFPLPIDLLTFFMKKTEA
ncbi:CLUMA_CG016297, isoform B [Clunio marinus]|uniref:CLUMA_CG016297, isoform B n=1 Tax=Clunio marinus TaxID=568069 RepID=A0A1J1IUC3_9DIPT|nr:CLUMA_CG016297, isoform B [Clunio marinus]